MDAVLLDTDVFSFLIRPGDRRGDAYRPHVLNKTIAISFITVGEIYYGAVKKGFAERTLANLEERIKSAVIVPYDQELCREYGRIRHSLPTGVTVGTNDLWIAACAKRYSIPLITNNRKHFEHIVQYAGLRMITESKAKPTKSEHPRRLFLDDLDSNPN
jgi:tRNA(fMet)-specific endonuclease VapC